MNSTPHALLEADTLLENVSLQPFNTFGLDVSAARYYRATSLDSLREVLRDEQPELILGGGSNLLFTNDLQGLVLHVDLKGVRIVSQEANEVLVQCGAGERWHDFVCHTLELGYGGLENLSLIPGSVGASPIQNIGAYGVEIKDHFHSLQALNRSTLALETFTAEDCAFGYRDSVFKRHLRGHYIIVQVSFSLTAKQHLLRFDYGDIAKRLEALDRDPEPQDVADAVIAIRQEKLPDPAEIGNSGSFFKNPVVDKPQFDLLLARRPDLRYYALPNDKYKLPAAWLIDQAGWKGTRRGPIGVHDRQALVLVNFGGGKGSDVLQLARDIQADVLQKFGVELEPEVNLL